MTKKLLLARPSHVPEGASSLFADYIHPAFRGTSVAFHTLRLLKHFRGASRDNAKGAGGTAEAPKHPYTHGGDLAAIARSVLQGKHVTKAGAFGVAPRNPFKVIGEWFKKLKGDGVVSIPDHLHDLADKYNYGTADRRHALDAKVYDMVHAIHGKGDHAATDLKLRDIGRKLLTATEDQKRGLTAAVKKQLRTHPLPADWHEELLNSLARLHQYALDRQMLKEEAHEKVRAKIVGPGKREGNISWRDWFMNASRDGKRGDPMRLYRDEEALPSLLAQVQAGNDHLSPILADAVEGAQREHDPESLAAMRSGKPHTIREVGGKIWAREKGELPMPGYAHHTVVHHAHGPGGEFLITTDNEPSADLGNYYKVSERRTFDEPGKPWHGKQYWNEFRRSPHPSTGFGEEYLAATKAHLDTLAAGSVHLSRVTQGIGAALRELASRNQRAREKAARALLQEAGEPGAVASVIAHHPELGFRASVLATLAAGDHYASEASRYLGAWHGSLTREPETVAFHAHDGGEDRLHILHAPVDPATLADALRDTGVQRFSIRPAQGRSTAFVYDRGGTFNLTPLAGRLNGRSIHSTGTGHRLGEGAGADSTAAYRDHIRAAEADTGGEAEAQRVPAAGVKLARLPQGAARAKDLKPWIKSIAEMPDDRVRRGAFADFLEEHGHHHDAGTLSLLRSHEGPLFVARHPKSKKVVAVPGAPETAESLNTKRAANHFLPQTMHHVVTGPGGTFGVVLDYSVTDGPNFGHHQVRQFSPETGRYLATHPIDDGHYFGNPRPLAKAIHAANLAAFPETRS